MEKQQTAIEWLETKVNGMIENGGDADLLAVIEHIQQAKEMEEKQKGYSEEEVLKILLAKNADLGIIEKTSEILKFIEQFKNK